MDVHVALTGLWWCVKPSTVALASLLLGIALLAFGRQRVGIVALAVSAFVLVNALFLPTARMLTTALERRLEPVAELPTVVDGIIVLGGNGEARLPAFARLATMYPEAALIFSGGGGEAESARRYLSVFDGLVERTVFENQSRNTYENARFSLDLVRPAADEVWLLVTSATHMARATKTFVGLGWSVIPYRVGSPSDSTGFAAIADRFRRLDEAVRELLATTVFEMTITTTPASPVPIEAALVTAAAQLGRIQ